MKNVYVVSGAKSGKKYTKLLFLESDYGCFFIFLNTFF